MTLSIKTETAQGWQIPNQQNFFLHGNEDTLTQHFIAKHDAVKRSSPTGFYNCHGLTFASRRTCVDDAHSINQILKDDHYVLVPHQEVLAGDVILYFEQGVVSHSGIVVEVPETFPKIPKVVSKWGAIGAEFVHWAHRSPYGSDFQFYRVDRTQQTKAFSNIVLAV